MGTANYISQMFTKIKNHTDNNTLIIGDLNTPLSAMDRSSKRKINKETRALKDTLDQMDFVDVYRTFHQSTYFSSCTRKLLQNRPYTGSQSRFQMTPKN